MTRYHDLIHCQSEATHLSLELFSVSLLFTSTSYYNFEKLIRETSVSYVLLPLTHTLSGCLIQTLTLQHDPQTSEFPSNGR